uniref:VWFD domain-containing protein n=1 Tax=Octopus bimaculoides TaxID=37653 RepID=A0A0L8FUP5_OCTBM
MYLFYLLAITCPEGFEFDECTAPCPRTCGNTDEISDCDLPCVAACRCPVGKFYENGKCINKEECPCEYEGKKFDENSTVKMDCNLCVCKYGKWVCEKQECPGTCTILGRNSIKTFDNLDYTIEPVSCRYTLVQSKSTSLELKISLEFGPCSSPYLDEFNCSTGLKIETANLFAKITKKGFFVNGNYRSDNSFFSKEIIIKQASSLFYVVDGLDFRILHYAGAQTYITLKSNYRGLVEGLCGNFDSNINNELVSRTGLLVHKTKFAQEFIAFSCFAPQRDDVESEPCEVNINNEDEAKKYCSYIPFSKQFQYCFEIVPYQKYYDQCMRDMCVSEIFNPNAMCVALQAYAKACADNGAIINWRENSTLNEVCSLECPVGSGQIYTECGSLCETTCHELSQPLTDCNSESVFGCRCPNGTLLNNQKKCVKIEYCTCFDKYTQLHYDAGTSLRRKGDDCVCTRGKWICQEAKEEIICPKNQIWSMNATSCQETCATLSKPEKCVFFSNEYEGCRCEKDLVMSPNGSCIDRDACPCPYGETWMMPKSILKIGCKELLEPGVAIWFTSPQSNSPTHASLESTLNDDDDDDDDDVYVVSGETTCWASGDPHYFTFDGIHYTFEGDCEYVLTEAVDKTFAITIKNIKCGFPAVTCTKDVVVYLLNNKIHFVMDKIPTIDGVKISDRGIATSGFSIKKSDFYYSLFTNIGLTVQWDQGTRVYVHLAENWMGKVQGLCGNFDRDSTNDFMSRYESIERVPSAFAHSWRVFDCPMVPQNKPENNVHPCVYNSIRKQWAMESCGTIKKGPLFASCRNILPDNVVKEYYEDCLYDACGCNLGGDCECLCTAVANFATKCATNGVPVNWRSSELCVDQNDICVSVAQDLDCVENDESFLKTLRRPLSRYLQASGKI